MRHTLKIVGWLGVGALAGALTTVSLQTGARSNMAPLPLEELQQTCMCYRWRDGWSPNRGIQKSSKQTHSRRVEQILSAC